ncbi:MAG: Mu-like prophage major head subunit gpT family protein [Dehalococcoidales bacterium]|nr:Mu-like prophage major head subunit gpT family protein [Dehalococcoidales bacterium]
MPSSQPIKDTTQGEAEARALEATEGRPREVEVTIIRPGTSANGCHYPAAILRAAAGLFEGAAAFADHPDALDQTRAGGRSIRDLVGAYHSARWEEGRGVRAVLRFLPSAIWAYNLVAEVLAEKEAGRPIPPLGISADLLVHRQSAGANGRRRAEYQVTRIEAVNSADLVFRPAAGGTFDRILNSRGGAPYPPKEDPAVPDTATHDPTQDATQDTSRQLEAELAAAREARSALAASLLDARLAAAQLPAPALEAVRKRFAGTIPTPTAIDEEITRTRDLLGAVASTGVVRGMGSARAQVGRTPLDNITLALERLFGLPLPDSARDVPRLSGIREAYLQLTGDVNFTGRYDWERSVVREANETTLAAMDSIVGNVMNKRLVADYQAQPKWWAPLVTVVDVKDMKLQTRVLLNDFSALATVAENGAYANVAWGDGAETYTPVKKGNIVYVTLETILNDDTHAFTRLPKKLAAAATVTINEVISALWTANAGLGSVMADTRNVFDLNHQSNTGVAALDATNLAAAIVVVTKMTNSASKRIGARPGYLLVPPDLAFTAATLLNSTLLPGSPNNDVNALQGIVKPIVVPNWTDVNNWYLHPDPREIEAMEVGFLNGRQEPELLVQDSPTSGSVFTNDAISWKVRWIFGAGWLDYRGCYGSIVA